MPRTLGRVSTLLLAAAILLVGHGLQLTLLPLRAESFGWTAGTIGLTGSAYFLGFVLGCVIIPGVVSQVAHIRTFMVMAAIVTVSLLAAGLLDRFAGWLALRCAIGFAISGLYMSIESWLADAVEPARRGTLLGIYSMISLASISAGQALTGLAAPDDLRLVIFAALIVALAIVPIGLTGMATPPPMPALRFSPRTLFRASRVAMLCSMFAGLVTGTFWALGPFAGRALGVENDDIGLLVACTVLGGAVSQIPAGRLSDRTDRRRVIAALFAIGLGAALAGWLLAPLSRPALYGAMFGIGFAVMPVYPLCIATAADNSETPMIQIGSSILIMNGLGSIAGPALAAPAIDALGAGRGFFLAIGIGMALGLVYTVARLVVMARPRTHEHAFLAVPKSSVIVTGMAQDVWAEEDADDEASAVLESSPALPRHAHASGDDGPTAQPLGSST